ncbi:hypothetical protein E2I00_013258 [Balaenoptera physalus]|uniref:Tyrosine-protein phosphatase non-receptor type n=1 Tax=Balaenoptera physalus TaxID=9770 RepID=A0A643CGD1_BALPH|nr:hypothetical protein E2I00_013258 [Balaenoptera physalus]
MPLPFGLKLKRTRRYTVSSKSCLVARIQLLNNEFVEFTLSVESTGQESLEAVAQRLELREITYFSLWYYNKQNQRRWVDLEKPLKKQLDKYALEPTVYFGVVFYVPSVSQLQQEITRYQYYLQLKKDILEGNIPCPLEQAIQLAGLAVQADFGDFDQYESQDFLQKFALLPVEWLQDEKVLEEATQKVALLHQKYRGLTAPDAEMLYMQEIERMDGYGEESYPAKDSQGSDISIGACLEGIFVKHKNGRPPAAHCLPDMLSCGVGGGNGSGLHRKGRTLTLGDISFTSLDKWHDIANMSHNKSFFALELSNKEETIQFQTEDMETAKYVWRLCVARHKFYRLNQCSLQTQTVIVNPIRRRSSSRMSLPKPQPYVMPPPPQLHYNGHYTEPYTSSQGELQIGLKKHASYQPRTDNLFVTNQNGYYCHSQTSLDRAQIDLSGRLRNGSVYSAHSTSSLNNPQPYLQPSPMSSNPSITGSDIMRPDYVPSHRHSALIPPSYRPTPDYETVMKQLHRGLVPAERQSRSLRNLNIGSSYAYSRPDALVYSQPEIREHAHFSCPPLPVAHSLQEVSEPLTSARHAQLQKRNSIEIAGLTHGFEGLRLKERTMSASAADVAPRAVSTGSQPNVVTERTKREEEDEHESLRYEEGEGRQPRAHARGRPAAQEGRAADALHVRGMKKSRVDAKKIGPLKLAALNGLSLSRLPLPDEGREVPARATNDERVRTRPQCKILEQRLEQGMVFTEYERILKKRLVDGECSTARLPENAERNRFQDVLPYDDARVELVPTKENNTGYINASHIKCCFFPGNSIMPFNWGNVTPIKMEKVMIHNRKVRKARCSVFSMLAGESVRCFGKKKFPYNPSSLVLVRCGARCPPPRAQWEDGGVTQAAALNGGMSGRVSVSGIEWDYIATQGPLQNTCQDFWQMVWEQGIAIIAMVTAEEEGGREKSFRYWPRLGSRHNTVTYGRFKITTRFRTDSGCYATTGLKMKHLLTGQERTVWHLQYTDWPEHGCPEDLKGFLSYLEEIQSVRRHTNSTSEPKSPNPPLLVHCSAGVGRTGVVILSEIMIACLEHNEVLDIPRVLDMLRQQRMMMVQTLCQYTFVYRVLIQFLKSSRLI